MKFAFFLVPLAGLFIFNFSASKNSLKAMEVSLNFTYLPKKWIATDNTWRNSQTKEKIRGGEITLTSQELTNLQSQSLVFIKKIKKQLANHYDQYNWQFKKVDMLTIADTQGLYFKGTYQKKIPYTFIVVYFVNDSTPYKFQYLGKSKKFQLHSKTILKIFRSLKIEISESPAENENDGDDENNNSNNNQNGNTNNGNNNSDNENNNNEANLDTTIPNFSGATAAAAISSSSITISWSSATDDTTNTSALIYNIYLARDDIEGENFSTATYTTNAGATSYTATDLQESTTYFFVIRSQDEAKNEDTNTKEVLVTTKSTDTDNNSPAASTKPTLISYQSQGATVYGLLYRPTQGTEPKPAIIYTFGGGGQQNLCSHWHNACDFSSGTTNGCGMDSGDYVVFIVGMRGDKYEPSGDCTGSSVYSDGSESRWRGDVNDGLAAIEWLKTKSFVDTSRLGIFGESVGGNNALLIASRSPDIKAVVAWFPHVDLEYIYNLWVNDNSLNIGWKGSALNNCAPTDSDSCAKEYRVRSPINYADKLTIPLQHSHCTADGLVPYAVSQQLYNYMQTTGLLNQTYTFYSYDGSTDSGDGCLTNNHGPFSASPWNGTAATRRKNFFDTNL